MLPAADPGAVNMQSASSQEGKVRKDFKGYTNKKKPQHTSVKGSIQQRWGEGKLQHEKNSNNFWHQFTFAGRIMNFRWFCIHTCRLDSASLQLERSVTMFTNALNSFINNRYVMVMLLRCSRPASWSARRFSSFYHITMFKIIIEYFKVW